MKKLPILSSLGFALILSPSGPSHGALLPEPATEWVVEVGATGDATPVAFPTGKPDGFVIAVPGRIARVDGSGKVLYDKVIPVGPEGIQGETYHFNAVPVDLDGDGKEEILGTSYRSLAALDSDTGDVLWQFDLGTNLDMFHWAVAADLDGDGKPEILSPNTSGFMHCLNADGTLRWRQRRSTDMISMAAVDDINNDGRPEVVYGTRDSRMIALDSDGHLLWETGVDPLNFGRSWPLIADADGNGFKEIYSMCANRSLHSGLAAFSGPDGKLLWEAEMTNLAYCTLAAVDLDGDGVQEILAGDKGNTLACFEPDGQMRWRKFVSGRGMWSRPAVADVNGDGNLEILQTVRGVGEGGVGWYAFDGQGEVVGKFPMEGGCYGSITVTDVDADGGLEVLVATRDTRKVYCYSFGGPAEKGAVLMSGWGEAVKPTLAIASGIVPESTAQPFAFSAPIPSLRYGSNPVVLNTPPLEQGSILEISATGSDGRTEIQAIDVEPRSIFIDATLSVWAAGDVLFTFRLIDQLSHDILFEQSLPVSSVDPAAPVKSLAEQAIQELDQIRLAVQPTRPEAASFLRQREIIHTEDLSNLLGRIDAARELTPIGHDQLSTDVDLFLQSLKRTEGLARLVRPETGPAKSTAFVMWQDENSWDNTPALDDLPEAGGDIAVNLSAVGNEIESFAIHFVNIERHGLTLRIEPGVIVGATPEKPAIPVHQFVKFHRALALPSRYGPTVVDMLPPLGDGYLVDIAPGETATVWVNVETSNIPAGECEIRWPIRTLDSRSLSSNLTLRLKTSPIRLPEKSRYAANYWSQNSLGDINTIPDLNRNGQNVWYRIPFPAAEADAEGNLVGELDWTAHDAIFDGVEDIRLILYSSGPPTPKFPDGADVSDELRLAGQRAYCQAVLNHLREKYNLGYENFAFYIEDETGMVGGNENFLRGAKAVKAIDPKLQVYANPIGMITLKMIEEMEPYTDVWQPGVATVEMYGKSMIDIMRGPQGDKAVWMFVPPGQARVLEPLGFYRAFAWIALHHGIEGGGWWVYQTDDFWASDPTLEPGFGAVAFDGRTLVGTRRWEATRDGIEDFNLVALLRDALEKSPDPAAEQLLDEAIAFAYAGNRYQGNPQALLDHTENYLKFEDYRERLIQELERLSAP